MLRRFRLLLGISIFWLALSVLSDGMNTLVLPVRLSGLAGRDSQATTLGLLSFVGLVAGALIQPLAGAVSDRFRPLLGRKGFIGIGLLLVLVSLIIFGTAGSLLAVMVAYLAIQVSTSLAQAGQQGLIPDLVDEKQRGLASGFKGFMDLAGAMAGFVLLGQLLSSNRTLPALITIATVLIGTYLLAVVLTPEDAQHLTAARPSAISLRQASQVDFPARAVFLRLLFARFLFLLGIYATGRFLLLFVADRLGLGAGQAAEQAGNLLAALALVTVLASPLAGWLADRLGRVPLMAAGAVLGAISAVLLIRAGTSLQILLFGALMSLGSAAFSGGSWAMLADLVPKAQSARYFGLANFSTAGATAAAGLFGPLIDGANHISPGSGYSVLFAAAALAFLASAFPLRHYLLREAPYASEELGYSGATRSDPPGLARIPLSANPAHHKEHQNPPGGPA